MIFLDQLLKKASDQGPNLTSYEFQTKWRGSDFWLTAQIAPQLRDSAVGVVDTAFELIANSEISSQDK